MAHPLQVLWTPLAVYTGLFSARHFLQKGFRSQLSLLTEQLTGSGEGLGLGSGERLGLGTGDGISAWQPNVVKQEPAQVQLE